MSELKSIEELKNKKVSGNKSDFVQKVEENENIVELTLLQEFEQDLSKEDKDIFDKIKDVLIEKIELYEHEAFSEENLKDIPDLIELFKRDILEFNEDSISLNLRRKLILDQSKNIFTEKLNFLFSRNKARERQYTKKIKMDKDDTGSKIDYTRAMVAASLSNIDFNNMKIAIAWTKLEKIHDKDYEILLILYGFFR